MYEMGDEESPSPSDHEELLQIEESEESTDVEEQKDSPQCQPKESTRVTLEELGGNPLDIFLTGLALMLSSTVLMVVFPVYMEKTDATPVMFLFPSTCCLLTLLLVTQILEKTGKIQGLLISRCPIPLRRLCEAALSYGSGCLLVTYAQGEGRVPCHLQDPLKAIVLILSLLYYFFLCKKMLGLRKLFAASVMTVGLFIAADYGLCDEFKCRGAESRIESSWQSRVIWTIVYLVGLGLFTLHFTLTEEHITYQPVGALYVSLSGSFLATVSRIVAREETEDQMYGRMDVSSSLPTHTNDQFCLPNNREKNKKSSIVIALWIQALTWLLMLTSGIFYMAASSTRGAEYNEILWNNTLKGLACHIPSWGESDNVRHLVNTLPAAAMTAPDYPSDPESNKLNTLDSMDTLEEPQIKANKRHLLEHVHYNREKGINKITKKKHEAHKHEKKIGSKKKRINKSSYTKMKINKKENKFKYELISKSIAKIDTDSPQTKETNAVTVKLNKTSIISSMKQNTELNESTVHKKPKITDEANIKRDKRTSDQTNALGFKIIQPTDSILQGHVITNKLKPDLVGHVILNKTSININGHEITFKQDLFIREHDPLPAKMHRQHRARIDIRFISFQNTTLPNNTSMKRSVRQSPIKIKEDLQANKTIHNNYSIKPTEKNLNGETEMKTTLAEDMENFLKSIEVLEDNQNKEKEETDDDSNVEIQQFDVKGRHLNGVTEKIKFDEKYVKVNTKEEFNFPPEKTSGRTRRNTENKSFNDSADVENFFKNIDIFENNLQRKNKQSDESDLYGNSRNIEVLKLEAIGNNFVRITEKRESDDKYLNSNNNVVYAITKLESEGCGCLAIYGWTIFIAYTIFSISSIRFLIISQSSVFTIAMMSPALPFAGVWWAIFSQKPDGSLVMQPGLSGELICALLGLPVVILGLILLFKAHLMQPAYDSQQEQNIFSGATNSVSTIKLCGDEVMTYELTNGSQVTHA